MRIHDGFVEEVEEFANIFRCDLLHHSEATYNRIKTVCGSSVVWTCWIAVPVWRDCLQIM